MTATNIVSRVGAVATVLALVTIVFGAYVRLTDAGLGCPDWPGCYGQLLVPESEAALAPNDPNLAARPLETGKAWREMIHRYFASTLGLLILVAVGAHLIAVRKGQDRLRFSMLLLAPLVMMQGVLGMWTVTLLLKPLVVMSHLMGGLTIFGLLVWNVWQQRAATHENGTARNAMLVRIGLVVLVGQLALGGWTSTNYAALACADFPTCHGTYLPPMDFKNGFKPWHGLGIDYEYGILDAPARIAIHYSHRIGAIVALLVLGTVGTTLIRRGRPAERRAGMAVLAALTLQLTLGVLNILWQLPLPVAVAHNFGAALLVASMVSALYHARRTAREAAPLANAGARIPNTEPSFSH